MTKPHHRKNSRASKHSSGNYTTAHKPTSHSYNHEPDHLLTSDLDVNKIIKIQAVYRGLKARGYIKDLKKQQRIKKKYFLEEEFNETLNKTNKLSSVKIKSAISSVSNSNILMTKSYRYNCTGALYEG